MKILSIDTHSRLSTISVFEDDRFLGEFSVDEEITHSDYLIVMINSLLERLEIEIKDIDLYCVVKGPGSFTGLRIGITTAKTFAQIFNKPIIGVSSLEALANKVFTHDYIIPIIDAKGGNVFFSIYSFVDGELVKLEEASFIKFDLLLEQIEILSGIIVFVGENTEIFKEKILLKNNAYIFNGNQGSIGSSVAQLGYKYFQKGEYEDPLFLKPDYLRLSQAQRDLLKKNIRVE